MRIISGAKRGFILNPPRKLTLRPTTDLCKESIFNILDNHFYFENISVLELFAGTGNISFEFASRGCNDITCVDINKKCIHWIINESSRLGFDFIEAIKADSLVYLDHFAHIGYDIIFADPPYDYKDHARIHEYVFNKELLKDNGWLLIEHDKSNNFSNLPYYSESRIYGQSAVSLFKNIKSLDNNNL